MGAVKGVGEAAIENIILSREQEGKYKDLFDFCRRVDTRKVNRRALEALIRAGSMNELGPNRASLMLALESALQAAEQHSQKLDLGQHDLFGEAVTDYVQPDMPFIAEWPMSELLQGEKEVLGFYLSGHPLQRYEQELLNFISAPLAQLNAFRNKTVIVAGWVVGLRTLFTKRGDRMAIVTLEDQSGRLDLTVFSEVFNTYRDFLNKDRLLIVEGEISIDEFTGNNKVLSKRLFDMASARETFAKHLIIKVDEGAANPILLEQLQQLIKPFCPGRTPVYLQYHRNDSLVNLLLGDKWQVKPTDQLLFGLQDALGHEAAYVFY